LGQRSPQDGSMHRAGWPWRLPARAPTDPDVRALTHPVLQPTGLPSQKGSPRLSERVTWTGSGASMCSTCFPRWALPAEASLPSPGSSGASSPASPVLSKPYDFLPPFPPHFVAFAWRYLGVHSFCSLPSGRVRRRGLELVTRYLQPGLSPRRRQDLPGSRGTPTVRLPGSVDAGRTASTRPVQCRSVALGHRTAKAPAKGLSALNSMAFGLTVYASPGGLPHMTQDSLPAVGQTLLDGLLPAGSQRKVSECLHLLLLSRALPGAIDVSEAD
jgi:hypothetical protein